mgnify:CR=1 FL=1
MNTDTTPTTAPALMSIKASLFAEPLLQQARLHTGESLQAHAQGTVQVLKSLDASDELLAAVHLSAAARYLNKPREVLAKSFGPELSNLAMETHELMQLQRQTVQAALTQPNRNGASVQTENIRRMLLAFSRDVRVVLLRLASRLQTLRFLGQVRQPVPRHLAEETLSVFAPLANRLGIWQIKWELEDLAFRAIDPDRYLAIARLLEDRRDDRQGLIDRSCQALSDALIKAGVQAKVYGRPKHIYSIHKKMLGKDLGFHQLMDLLAIRVIVPEVAQCYAALSEVHSLWTAIPEEFDDYIAKPKPNGYQSLHTVVRNEQGRAIEVQIRTQAMHDHAESGVAAHWAYKESGSKGYAGVVADGAYEQRIALMRQLLAWEREMHATASTDPTHSPVDDRIYVMTPQARIVDLPQGATAIDFAYHLHTDLGHRCRGARVDGVMQPLLTPLQSGQTVEIVAAKEGGPSRDWLSVDAGYLQTPRARAKVRAWFNAMTAQATIEKGREAIERVLQREGKTSTKLDVLAGDLGFKDFDSLCEAVGKDEYSLRQIELHFRPQEPLPEPDQVVMRKIAKAGSQAAQSGVLVVGVPSLLTQLGKCCRPAPPDPILGFVSRGKGITIHRVGCTNASHMQRTHPERIIDVSWEAKLDSTSVYPVHVEVLANDRQGLLRDVSEVFAREKLNVIGVQTASFKELARMGFTVEVHHTKELDVALHGIQMVNGVKRVKRA